MQQLWRFWRTVLGVVFRHPVLGVSIIPVLENGQIVLVKRRDNQCWSLPGGMVDWGQDLETTVHRELAEETGLTVRQMGRLVGIYSTPERDPRLHSVCVAIEAYVQGEGQVGDPAEILAVQAFDRSEIPMGELSHDHDRQLHDYWRCGPAQLA